MKKVLQQKQEKRYSNIIGIDASTRGIGLTYLEDGEIKSLLRLNLPTGDINERLLKIREWFSAILKLYKAEIVVIESAIFIQNPLTTKHISYAIGIIYGECLKQGIDVTDVSPSAWKAFLGYRPITKKMKENMINDLGKTEGVKKINKLKKSQVQNILRDRYPQFGWEDDNIADSAGIALYAHSIFGPNR